MPERAKKTTEPQREVQIAVRLQNATVLRVDAIVEKMSQPGLTVSRSEALRIALYRGLETLEAEDGKRVKVKRSRARSTEPDESGHLQTAVRLPSDGAQRIDDLADRMSQPGWRVSRSEALRVALHRGLEVLEAEKKQRP
jgi:Arc/MetJ-type ribon-helix-helix transcriptional regulator